MRASEMSSSPTSLPLTPLAPSGGVSSRPPQRRLMGASHRRNRASWSGSSGRIGSPRGSPQLLLHPGPPSGPSLNAKSPRSGLETLHSALFSFSSTNSPSQRSGGSLPPPIISPLHSTTSILRHIDEEDLLQAEPVFHRERFRGDVGSVPVPPASVKYGQPSLVSPGLMKRLGKMKPGKGRSSLPASASKRRSLRHDAGSSFATSPLATSSMHQINRQLQIGEQIERFQGLSIASHECPRCLNNEEIIADLHNTIALRDAKLKNMELQARHIRVKSSKVEYSDEYVKLSSELDAAVADVAEKQAVIEELLAQATGLVAAKDRERKANLDLRGELEEWQKQALDEGGTPLLRSKAATRRNSTVSGGNPGELTDAELCAKNEAFRMNVKSQCYSLECEIKDLKAKHQADLSKAAARFERKERQAQAAEIDIEDLRTSMAAAAEQEDAAKSKAQEVHTRADDLAEKLELMTKQRDSLLMVRQRNRAEYERMNDVVSGKDTKIQELLMELAARDEVQVKETKRTAAVLEEMVEANFVEQDAAVDLLQGGTLQATLSLAGSSDLKTREKAKGQLQAFVNARKQQLSEDNKLSDVQRKKKGEKNQLFTRQLNTAATAIQLIQNWTEKVGSAVVEPAVRDQAEVLIIEARKKVATYQPGLGVRFQTEHGAESTNLIYIVPGSSAEAAGLQVGDLVERVDGVNTNNQVLFKQEVARRKPGELVPFTVCRRGQLMEIKVRIGAAGQALAEVRNNLRLAECIIYRTDLIKNAHPDYVVRSKEFFCDIFLGGSCNPTTWRKDAAIPMFEMEGVSFYNPQIEDWTPDLVEIESKAKDSCKILLFVIDNQTRAIASMLEAAEYIGVGRKVVCVIQAVEEGQSIAGDLVPPHAVKDFNRARSYLRDIANRHGIPCFSKIPHAIQECVNIVKGRLEVRIQSRNTEGWNEIF